MSNALIPFFYLAIFLILCLQKYLEIGWQIKFENNSLLNHGFLYVSREQALILAETDSASSSVATFLF